jgi:MFS family permease
VRALTDSFATAGAAVGIYLGASAATAPFMGRWIDRRGPRLPLGLTGIVGPAALIVILFAQPLALSTPALWLLAGIAGAFSPPISVLTRTMWRYRFSDAAARRTAFALDSVLVEFTFTAGPALIALLLVVGSPAIAFSAACLFAVLAVPTFVASPAMRYWRHDPHAERHRADGHSREHRHREQSRDIGQAHERCVARGRGAKHQRVKRRGSVNRRLARFPVQAIRAAARSGHRRD